MPTQTDYGEQYPVQSSGPNVQALVPATAHGLVATVPAMGSITSNTIFSDGYKRAAIGVTSTQAGNITVQRYLDDAATIKQGAALTASLSANTAQVLNITDENPFASFTVNISNSSGSIANLTNVGILLQAQ